MSDRYSSSYDTLRQAAIKRCVLAVDALTDPAVIEYVYDALALRAEVAEAAGRKDVAGFLRLSVERLNAARRAYTEYAAATSRALDDGEGGAS